MSDIVTTVSGAVRGSTSGAVWSFKGIPYAAPPFGVNRFRPPQPSARWEGVRDALGYGPTATRGPYPEPLDQYLPEPVIDGDDCLNLNVWTPDPGAAGLPVMVWIHGGAFANGSGAVAQYAGDRFARDGVVCVTINYRLGADGFLLLEDGPANLGLLDQIAALEWVRDNIAAFGGDPHNVTVFGESAGAMSVITLLAMPQSTGLVRRAIAQSGAGHHTISESTARLIASELAVRLGVAPRRDAMAAVPLDRLDAAQRALAIEIGSTPDPSRWGEVVVNLMPFEPVVDGQSLPSRPVDAIRGGAARAVDLLVGSNRHESRLFLVPTGLMDLVDEPTLAFMAGLLGMDAGGVETYRAARPDATAGELLDAVTTDWMFRIPAVRVAEGHVAGPGSTHMYEFAWPSALLDGRLGACHALEIGFVFDTLDADGGDALFGPDAPRELATTMHRAWIDFATTGDPGWAAYDLTDRSTMTFDVRSDVVRDPRAGERVLWDGRR